MTAPVQSTKRADELTAGMAVMAGTATLTVGAIRTRRAGEVEIRWAGGDLWAIVKANRTFTVVGEAKA